MLKLKGNNPNKRKNMLSLIRISAERNSLKSSMEKAIILRVT